MKRIRVTVSTVVEVTVPDSFPSDAAHLAEVFAWKGETTDGRKAFSYEQVQVGALAAVEAAVHEAAFQKIARLPEHDRARTGNQIARRDRAVARVLSGATVWPSDGGEVRATAIDVGACVGGGWCEGTGQWCGYHGAGKDCACGGTDCGDCYGKARTA